MSFGTFFSLKPFYIRPAIDKDVEMCCCEKHLHAQWSIKALIDLCHAQSIDTGTVLDYYPFFDLMTKHCEPAETSHVSWDCVKDKKELCHHIKEQWNKFSTQILEKSNEDVKIKFQHFEKVQHVNKNGKISDKLKAVTDDVCTKFIIDFISELLPKIICHRNHLKHYQTVLPIFKEYFAGVLMDVDYSKNLSIPVKFEPQSLHWSHAQVTVHSGMVKTPTEKTYHPYISDEKKHDQVFAQLCIEHMMNEITVDHKKLPVVIESDNCRSQYKSALYFWGMQKIADEKEITVIRIYRIAEHGKGRWTTLEVWPKLLFIERWDWENISVMQEMLSAF